ncbi:MAG: 16S rRNA (adenine(1518)-N(6)/adenine(1519)-N(6))-dimethyltransferase RsmA, partial [Kiritimatiellae bacterium]|nr:16S rRNA (adenine(1518)-N(6)/adenine(1519)-N(6))-dimethyltransferase RsmA [Kiritimatiellia bacterium]
RRYLKQCGFTPSKTMGQNFLVDGNIRDQILQSAGVAGERVVEIGPGLGMLTEGLLERTDDLLAIEKDAVLCRHLQQRFEGAVASGQLQLMEADALDVDWSAMAESGRTHMISNLPYGVGNRILVNAALGAVAPERITVMVQRDVAERMMAGPGGKEFGVLSLFLQLRYDVSLVRHVSPSCFVPEPRVWSSVVSLRRNSGNDAGLRSISEYRLLVRDCFSCRRKQMQVILHKHAHTELSAEEARALLEGAGIPPMARPETVERMAWIALANALHARRLKG